MEQASNAIERVVGYPHKSLATTTAVGTSCPAGGYCSIQGPELGSTVGCVFSPSCQKRTLEEYKGWPTWRATLVRSRQISLCLETKGWVVRYLILRYCYRYGTLQPPSAPCLVISQELHSRFLKQQKRVPFAKDLDDHWHF